MRTREPAPWQSFHPDIDIFGLGLAVLAQSYRLSSTVAAVLAQQYGLSRIGSEVSAQQYLTATPL